MAVNLLAAQTARVQDLRCAPMSISLGTLVADANLDGGYGVQITIGSGNTFFNNAVVALVSRGTVAGALSTTYGTYAWCDMDITSWFTGGTLGSADGLLPILSMDNGSSPSLQLALRTGLVTTVPTRAVAIMIDRALNYYLYMNENGTVTTSASLGTLSQAKHNFELFVTAAAGPHLSIQVRIDKGAPSTLTSANPFVGWSVTNARCGWLDTKAIPAATNGTGTLVWGNLTFSDSASGGGWPLDLPASTVSGPHAEVLLPNGDGATTQWLTDAGLTGTYTRWNEALGTWAADSTYNHCTTGAGPLDQQSTFPNTARVAADVISGVGLNGQTHNLSGAAPFYTSTQFVINDGVESAKAVQPTSASDGTQQMTQDMWNAPPSGGSWTPTKINGLTWKARRTNADTNDNAVYTWYALVWYYTGASTTFFDAPVAQVSPRRWAQQPPSYSSIVMDPSLFAVPAWQGNLTVQAQVFPRRWAQQPPSYTGPVMMIPAPVRVRRRWAWVS